MSVSIQELNSTSINLFRGFFTDDILPHLHGVSQLEMIKFHL